MYANAYSCGDFYYKRDWTQRFYFSLFVCVFSCNSSIFYSYRDIIIITGEGYIKKIKIEDIKENLTMLLRWARCLIDVLIHSGKMT